MYRSLEKKKQRSLRKAGTLPTTTMHRDEKSPDKFEERQGSAEYMDVCANLDAEYRSQVNFRYAHPRAEKVSHVNNPSAKASPPTFQHFAPLDPQYNIPMDLAGADPI